MWVRVSRSEGGSADHFEEGMSYMEEKILPAARQMPGWQEGAVTAAWKQVKQLHEHVMSTNAARTA